MKKYLRKILVYLITTVMVVPSVLISSYLTAESAMASSPIVLLQEGFDAVPVFAANWTANGIDGTYTTPGNFGITTPSIKFDATGDSLITPLFSSADKVSFWAKGQGVDVESSLKIEYLASGTWNQVAVLKPIPTTGTNVEYALTTDATQIRFTYNKSVGNLALDDVKILGTANDDITAPELKSIFLDKQTIDTSVADQQVILTAHIIDSQSGACIYTGQAPGCTWSTSFTLKSSISGQSLFFATPYTLVSGDALDGVYTAAVIIPKGSAAGTWRIESAQIADKVGNSLYLRNDLLTAAFGAAVISVNNLASDRFAPTATISYSTNEPTTGSVIATITPSEPIQEIALTHEFTENGTYTFIFTDLAGNVGSAIATVSNIDKTAPAITIGTYNTAPTNQNVIVIASSIDGTLNTVSYTFTENGSFDFVATDAAGNSTTKTVTLDNIDKTAPTAIVGYSTTEPTKGSVTATITASELIQEQVISYEFADNGTHTFNFTDLAGNVGSVVATVSNIDKTAPIATVSYSVTEPTNYNVIATITPSEPIQEIALTHEFTENGTYTFIFTDLAGNDGSVVVTVSNIDKVAPVAILYSNYSAPTNANILKFTLKCSEPITLFDLASLKITNGIASNLGSADLKDFTFDITPILDGDVVVELPSGSMSDDYGNTNTDNTIQTVISDTTAPTATISYSTTNPTNGNVIASITPSEPIQENTLTHEFTENGTYTFNFTDLAGNMGSAVATVENIDKVAPIITIGTYNTAPTNQNVIVTAYTIDGTLNTVSSAFTENGSFDFVATDAAGNSTTTTVTVENIDKIVPIATVGYSAAAPTKQSVTATITPSELIQEKVISHEFTDNGTYTFTFTDLAGNIGSVAATVSNIDKTAPIITIGTYNTAPTNQNVVVAATTSEGVLNYVSHEFKENDTFTFTATDAAGNITSETVTIGNIDKTAPTAEVGYSTTEPTKQSVTAIIIPSEAIQETSLTHVFTENGTYTFRFTDIAGNDGTATANVSNIDKTAPIEIKVPKGYAENMDIKTTTGGTTLNLGDSLVAGEIAGTKTAKMEGSSKISSEISSGNTVVVEMASGTTVTGPDTWDGIVKLPEVTANPASVKVVTGNYATNIASIEIGMPDVKLTFSRAVRIIIPGAAGKYAGYTRSDVFTAISDVCTANTQEAGDKLAAEGDCKIDSGADLVIWTKHFTKFVTYNQSLVVLPVAPVTTVETPVVVAQPEVISSPDPIVVRPKPTAPAKAEAAAPETKIETPKDDESGIVKGEDLGTDEANNWTPWIILFILILLAGAATGGYFYWFSDTPEGEEKAKEKATAKDKVKIQVRDKATEKSVEKAIEPEKNVEKQKEVTKQAAPQAKAPIVSNPVQNVKPAQGASKNNHKKTKRW